MKSTKFTRHFFAVIVLPLWLAGCNADSSSPSSLSVPLPNIIPTIDAGSDRSINEQAKVFLQGSANDSDGDIISFSWQQTTGSAVIITDSQSQVATFIAPTVSVATTLSFELTVADNDGAEVVDTVNIDIQPLITGLAVDDLIVDANVELLGLPDLQLIQQTTTDELGVYRLSQQLVPERFLLRLSGGTMNGQAFLGQMFALCDLGERSACHITPISTLVNRYAQTKEESLSGDKNNWLKQISASLQIDLQNDPFINQTPSGVDLEAIREQLQNGANLSAWVEQILEFIEDGSNSDTVMAGFTQANRVPQVTLVPQQQVDEQTRVTLTATATDPDGSIAHYQWTQTAGIPVPLINSANPEVTFTSPTLITAQQLAFELMVTDDQGASASEMLIVTVNPVNLAPMADAGPTQTVPEQTTVALTAAANDSDGNITSYLWSQTGGTSVNLTSTDSADTRFTAPILTRTEILTFQLTVVDNEAAMTNDTINITVNPVNIEPTADAGAQQTVDEQTTVNLSANATDNDGSIVQYQWTQIAGPTITLLGANSANGSFTAPTLTEVQTLTLQLTVTDNEAAIASDTVSIIVKPVNLLPTVNAGAQQTIDEQTTVNLNANASDDDGSIVQYQWTQIAGSAATLLRANSTNASFIAPTLTETQTLTLQLTVTDNEAAIATDTVNIIVNPVNLVPTVDAGPQQTVDEQTTINFSANATDNDGSIVQYQWTQIAGSTIALLGANSANASFTTPTLTEAQTLTLQLTVIDNEAATATDTVNIIVNPVNLIPTVDAGPQQTVDEQATVNLSANATDSDGYITSYQWSQIGGTTVNLISTDSADTRFTAPTLTSPETLTFQLTVVDNEAAITNDTVNITVKPVNLAPTVDAGAQQTVDEQTIVNLSANATDNDGSIVQYQWTQIAGSTTTLLRANSANASFTAPTLTEVQTLTLQLTVTDNEAAIATDTVTIIVKPVNLVPTVNAGAQQTVDEQTTVSLTAIAIDVDGGIVSHQWRQTAGTTVNLNTANTLNANFEAPTITSTQTLTFQFTAIDNETAAASDSVNIIVKPVNLIPTVDAGPGQTIDEQTTVILAGNASDTDGNIANYQWRQTDGAIVSLSESDKPSASFMAPTLTAAQTLTFQLIVSDNEAKSATDTVNITVNPVNLVPTADAGPEQTVDEQTVVNLTASANDNDGSIVNYQWIQTAGTLVDLNHSASVAASFKAPTLNIAQTLTFKLTVTDNEGAVTSDSVNININPINRVPIATIKGQTEVSTNSLVSIDGSTSSDADGDALSYLWSVTSQPDNSAIQLSDLPDGQTTFTPIIDGQYMISLTVNDGVQSSAPQTMTITAITPINTLPEIQTFIANPEDVALGEATTFIWSVSDADNDTLTCVIDITGNGEILLPVDKCNGRSTLPYTYQAQGRYIPNIIVSDGKSTVESAHDLVDISDAAIDIFLRSPQHEQIFGDEVVDTYRVVATVRSTLVVDTVIAQMLGQQQTMTFSQTAYQMKINNQLEWQPGFIADFPLGSAPIGEKHLKLTARDINGNQTVHHSRFIFDRKPKLIIDSPLKHSVATSSKTPLNIRCTDDTGDCQIEVKTYAVTWASGINQVNTTIDLSEYNGWNSQYPYYGSVMISITLTDALGQHTFTENPIYVELSDQLSFVANAPNRIKDFDGQRMLTSTEDPNDNVPAVLSIYDGINGTTNTIPVPTDRSLREVDSYLTPNGAIFEAIPSGVYEWYNSSLSQISFATDIQTVTSDYALLTSGNSLWRRQFSQDNNILIQNRSPSTKNQVTQYSLAHNGNIGFSTQTTDEAYIYADNEGFKLLTDSDSNPVSAGSVYLDTMLGTTAVYEQSCVDNLGCRLFYHDGITETFLAEEIKQSDFNAYTRVKNDWAVWLHDFGTGQQLGVYHPQFFTENRILFGTPSRVESLNDIGEVMLINGAKRYLSTPFNPLREIGTSLGKVYYLQGNWYITIGASVLKVKP